MLFGVLWLGQLWHCLGLDTFCIIKIHVQVQQDANSISNCPCSRVAVTAYLFARVHIGRWGHLNCKNMSHIALLVQLREMCSRRNASDQSVSRGGQQWVITDSFLI